MHVCDPISGSRTQRLTDTSGIPTVYQRGRYTTGVNRVIHGLNRLTRPPRRPLKSIHHAASRFSSAANVLSSFSICAFTSAGSRPMSKRFSSISCFTVSPLWKSSARDRRRSICAAGRADPTRSSAPVALNPKISVSRQIAVILQALAALRPR